MSVTYIANITIVCDVCGKKQRKRINAHWEDDPPKVSLENGFYSIPNQFLGTQVVCSSKCGYESLGKYVERLGKEINTGL